MQLTKPKKLILTPLLISLRTFSVIILFLWLAALFSWPRSYWGTDQTRLRWTRYCTLYATSSNGYIRLERQEAVVTSGVKNDPRRIDLRLGLSVSHRPDSGHLIGSAAPPTGLLSTYQTNSGIWITTGLAFPHWLALVILFPLACFGFLAIRQGILWLSRPLTPDTSNPSAPHT